MDEDKLKKKTGKLKSAEEHHSFWKPQSAKRYPKLIGEKVADVAIVGGGIAGVTAALLLARHGKSVILLERDRIGSGETLKTTAHLTEAMDVGYHSIEADFGKEGARLVATGTRSAVEMIAAFAREYSIPCQLERVPGFLYTESGDEKEFLQKEADAARRAGLQVEIVSDVPLPFATGTAVRFEGQAQFHPGEYLLGLASAFVEAGGTIYEHSPLLGMREGEPIELETPDGMLEASQVFIAAHVPINNRFTLFTKIASYRSYAMAIRTPHAERFHGLFWDTMDPYHYIRRASVNGEACLIVGGEDHKTGMQSPTDHPYQALEKYARDRFGAIEVKESWSGQIIEPVDGLPYVGANPFSENVFVATGFSGQGMTLGTLSARIVTDQILGKANAWGDLFSPSRFKPLASATEFLSENKDFPIQILKDRLDTFRAPDVAALPAGEGKIVKADGQALAVYRDENQVLHSFSPVCPHMGCHVAWNSSEKTWDCPCHGSRFGKEDGGVINGPARCGLKRVSVEETALDERARRGADSPGEVAKKTVA